MRLRTKRIRVGEMMMWFKRFLWYIQIPFFFVNLAANIVILKVSPWWLLMLIPFSLFVLWLDVKVMAPGGLQSSTNRNPEWERFIKEDIQAIKKALKI